MKTLKLNNGLMMPQIGLGTWLSEKDLTYKAIIHAVKTGYRHIDCALIYQNEEEVGRALKFCFDNNLVRREDLWITSKLWNTHHKFEDVEEGMNTTLKDLGLDYLDLYLIHWPVPQKKEVLYPETKEELYGLDEVPSEETWRGMEEMVKKGKTKTIGVANFSAHKLVNLYNNASIKPAVNQVEIHPFLPQTELRKVCGEYNIVLTAYSPLGSPGRPDMMKGESEPSLLFHPIVQRISEAKNVTPAQVLISWGLSNDYIIIPKSTNPKRIEENFHSINVELSDSEKEEINQIDMAYRFCRPDHWFHRGINFEGQTFWDS
ncbi:aldo/keto reductase [Bacteriovoracaceae bacterium]|nr:aldo/keto reductase [Bacteriovoracaceae bacterium]